MKYKFKFQKILDIKEKLEESKKMEISNLLNDINKIKDQINYLNENKRLKSFEMKNLMQEGTNINTLRYMNEFIYSIEVNIQSLKEKLVIVENELEIKKKEYIEIMRDKKTFENLKEKDFQKFNEKLRKEEEQFVDQIVTFKHSTGN